MRSRRCGWARGESRSLWFPKPPRFPTPRLSLWKRGDPGRPRCRDAPSRLAGSTTTKRCRCLPQSYLRQAPARAARCYCPCAPCPSCSPPTLRGAAPPPRRSPRPSPRVGARPRCPAPRPRCPSRRRKTCRAPRRCQARPTLRRAPRKLEARSRRARRMSRVRRRRRRVGRRRSTASRPHRVEWTSRLVGTVFPHPASPVSTEAVICLRLAWTRTRTVLHWMKVCQLARFCRY
mmetsp:Transcript_1555/g.5331  ORF Transcript_1555/g.5331 Transcript_1555/m.5331 type:complete len:233 (+) Transcript_1555:3248-3946(+)